MADTIRLIGESQRAYAKRLIDEAPNGHVMKLGAETRRDAQNRLMWALIEDLRKQIPEMSTRSKDDTKLQFLDQLGVEMRYLPKLEGQGFFPVGLSSSTLTVEQFSGLCDLIYEWGARHGVRFKDKPA